MRIAFVPASSWKILPQTILSQGTVGIQCGAVTRKNGHIKCSPNRQSIGITILQAAKDWTGPLPVRAPWAHGGSKLYTEATDTTYFGLCKCEILKAPFPLNGGSEFKFLFQTPRYLNDKTWVDGREVVSENPATDLWKQSSYTSCLEALAPSRGSQATGLTTKQAGEKLEALGEPVTPASWQVPHVWWLLPHDQSNDSRKEQNFFFLVSLPKQVQTRTWAIPSHWPIILKDLRSTRTTGMPPQPHPLKLNTDTDNNQMFVLKWLSLDDFIWIILTPLNSDRSKFPCRCQGCFWWPYRKRYTSGCTGILCHRIPAAR